MTIEPIELEKALDILIDGNWWNALPDNHPLVDKREMSLLYDAVDVVSTALRAQLNRENPEPLTNADRIRAMSNEELAEFLCHFRSDHSDCFVCMECVANNYCKAGHSGMIDWLQQPAEEATP